MSIDQMRTVMNRRRSAVKQGERRQRFKTKVVNALAQRTSKT